MQGQRLKEPMARPSVATTHGDISRSFHFTVPESHNLAAFGRGSLDLTRMGRQRERAQLSRNRNSLFVSHAMQVKAEILETEEAYVQGLELLSRLYIQPLKVAGILSAEDISSIFNNLEMLTAVNRALLSAMHSDGIVQAFATMAPFLKVYSLYAENFESSMEKIQQQVKKNRRFRKFKELQTSLPESKDLGLEALMLAPIQRLPRYKLLLEALLAATPATDPSRAIIQDVVERVTQVNDHVNAALRRQDSRLKLLDLQRRLQGRISKDIVRPNRVVVLEDFVLIISKSLQPKHLKGILLSDMLILAKPSLLSGSNGNKSLTCTHTFALAESELVVTRLPQPKGQGRSRLCFQITQGSTRAVLAGLDDATTRQWSHEVRKHIDIQRKNRQSFKIRSSGVKVLSHISRAQSSQRQSLRTDYHHRPPLLEFNSPIQRDAGDESPPATPEQRKQAAPYHSTPFTAAARSSCKESPKRQVRRRAIYFPSWYQEEGDDLDLDVHDLLAPDFQSSPKSKDRRASDPLRVTPRRTDTARRSTLRRCFDSSKAIQWATVTSAELEDAQKPASAVSTEMQGRSKAQKHDPYQQQQQQDLTEQGEQKQGEQEQYQPAHTASPLHDTARRQKKMLPPPEDEAWRPARMSCSGDVRLRRISSRVSRLCGERPQSLYTRDAPVALHKWAPASGFSAASSNPKAPAVTASPASGASPSASSATSSSAGAWPTAEAEQFHWDSMGFNRTGRSWTYDEALQRSRSILSAHERWRLRHGVPGSESRNTSSMLSQSLTHPRRSPSLSSMVKARLAELQRLNISCPSILSTSTAATPASRQPGARLSCDDELHVEDGGPAATSTRGRSCDTNGADNGSDAGIAAGDSHQGEFQPPPRTHLRSRFSLPQTPTSGNRSAEEALERALASTGSGYKRKREGANASCSSAESSVLEVGEARKEMEAEYDRLLSGYDRILHKYEALLARHRQQIGSDQQEQQDGKVEGGTQTAAECEDGPEMARKAVHDPAAASKPKGNVQRQQKELGSKRKHGAHHQHHHHHHNHQRCTVM